MPIACRESGERKGGEKNRYVNSPSLDEEGKVCPLVRDVFRGAPVGMDWERVDVLHYIDLREYHDAKCFGVLLVYGREFWFNTN